MMKKIFPLSLLAALALSACAKDEPSPTAIRQNTHPVVSDLKYSYRVPATADGTIAVSELARLDSFVSEINPTFGDSVVITGGSQDSQIELERFFKARNLEVYRQTSSNSNITLLLSKAVVTVGNCGNWNEVEDPTNGQALPDNHGCANRNNLARMLAAPGDLRNGRTLSNTIAGPEILGLQKYRTGTLRTQEATSSNTTGEQ
ncbi:CpaD family pilus assembly lipoprotein [Kiloniella sp. b19]|uniref:CpaD family pilus assembly lipoprotein n=1 Tax=Kiloniella sp. GXU_MW_B19 TaxID=3141326 RepID=UPI0031D85B40